MDKQIYDLVKDAIANGKSLEEITQEFTTIAKKVDEDLQPKTAISEKYAARFVTKKDLISMLASYIVRQGFNPDLYFESDDQLREQIAKDIDEIVHSYKSAARVVDLKNNGANATEILKAMFDGIFSTESTKEFDF